MGIELEEDLFKTKHFLASPLFSDSLDLRVLLSLLPYHRFSSVSVAHTFRVSGTACLVDTREIPERSEPAVGRMRILFPSSLARALTTLPLSEAWIQGHPGISPRFDSRVLAEPCSDVFAD